MRGVRYQTREGVFHQISKRLRGVWISDETLLRVFDMTSQMINNRPFYSCVFSDLALDFKRGWG